jgi:penicillin V acylase-like amidase (Ntn superfamily)
MKYKTLPIFAFLTLCQLAVPVQLIACSVLYYFDDKTSTAFVANNEDYWLDQEVDIKIFPSKGNKHARLWYGWDDFAQGGVNEHGLFFDGAVTPESEIPSGYSAPRGNLGNRILADCRTVEEALEYLENEKVALKNAHMMIGDSSGNAVVVEWIDSERVLSWVSNRKLIMTNFLLAKTKKDEIECPRYQSIQAGINDFRKKDVEANLLTVGNMLGEAVQLPRETEKGKLVGTLYSTFLDLKNMKLVYVPKLDSSKVQKFDLIKEFSKTRGRKVKIR